MITDLYNATVDVLRITRTSDGMGGSTEVEVVHINDLPCRINWSRGSERIMFGKDSWFRDAKMYCGIVDIQTKERILYDSKTYEVVNVSNVDNMDRFLTVEMRLVE